MMKHGERNSSRKLSIRKRRGSCLPRNHFNIPATKACLERLRQLGINFDCRDAPRGEPQQICRETRPRSKLKDVLSKVRVREGPRYSLLDGFSASGGTAQP